MACEQCNTIRQTHTRTHARYGAQVVVFIFIVSVWSISKTTSSSQWLTWRKEEPQRESEKRDFSPIFILLQTITFTILCALIPVASVKMRAREWASVCAVSLHLDRITNVSNSFRVRSGDTAIASIFKHTHKLLYAVARVRSKFEYMMMVNIATIRRWFYYSSNLNR